MLFLGASTSKIFSALRAENRNSLNSDGGVLIFFRKFQKLDGGFKKNRLRRNLRTGGFYRRVFFNIISLVYLSPRRWVIETRLTKYHNNNQPHTTTFKQNKMGNAFSTEL